MSMSGMSGLTELPRRPDFPTYSTPPSEPYKGYALSGKIMLSAIVILFFVVILMVCLHLYARWYLLRARRRNLRRNRRNRRNHLIFHEDEATAAVSDAMRGLDESVLKSLPVFVYDSKTHPEPILECAVCLSEFEENETGRVLPKCKHSFHIECIDMWFHSHSTCPLCRCAVEPQPESENPGDVVLNVCEPESNEPGSSSGLCSECSGSRSVRQTSSFGPRRKPMDIAVPSRHESFGRSEAESPSGQAFRSPMSRMLSFKRMLSRDKRNGGVSPSGNASCSSVAELDIERGREGAE
ncbi:putative transcription factor C2H2 family [Rosa chinensis]|uniref:RING-type E3 ubiquitin transferase n=1 Tax=Rosa chinensis TaxID=74649 RepID=A0A2P6QYJ5_ROSCH|nr:RING-H2 finger protein ATL2 [Rosa chinensis]PRQ39272.1 putative transcription factor C2H2 family [Rosa chinensis]